MGPNSAPASVSEVTQLEVDDELLNKMTTLKVETLNSGASQKVASFYRSVRTKHPTFPFIVFSSFHFQEAPVFRGNQSGQASYDQFERFRLKSL